MFIKAYERINYPSRISVLARELQAQKELVIIGYYEEMDDCFYCLNGSYELEAAYQIGLPLKLMDCQMEDSLHYSEIGYDDMLENYKGQKVFNNRGKAEFMCILEAIPSFSGKEYLDDEFAKVETIPYAEYKKLNK